MSESEPTPPPVTPSEPSEATTQPGHRVTIALDRGNIWAVAWTIVAVVAITQLLRFVVRDGGSVIFTLIMSWVASVAMEPAVARLSRRWGRPRATVVVMLSVLLAVAAFVVIFGRLLGEQIVTFVQNVPELATSLAEWANSTFGSNLDPSRLLDALDLTSDRLSGIALNLAGGILGFIAAVVGSIFSVFTFGFFTYYLSADAPRLRRWIARLFPPAQQEVVATVWDLAVAKTGGYIAARLVLACICGSATALFLLVIGMQYWLALGIWTGLVAQFVPTVGTYIAIALPVFVGLIGDRPVQGILALVFAIVYQQLENLTIEPRISARAVNVHPAASFGAVMLGAALFGVAGAFIAVPMAALLLALTEIYARKYELLPRLREPAVPEEEALSRTRARESRLARWLIGQRWRA
jgi:predicted PurR-regulated permease PerM